eukprot:609448_1
MASAISRYFFLYGSYRDDAMSPTHHNAKSLLEGMIEAKTAKVFGYKMYQRKWSSQPFAIQTKKKNDFIIGRLITFDDALFDQKLKQIKQLLNCSSVATQKEYSTVQEGVNVYLENDHQKALPYRAIMFIKYKRNIDMAQSIVVESNDWLRRNILTSETK